MTRWHSASIAGGLFADKRSEAPAALLTAALPIAALPIAVSG